MKQYSAVEAIDTSSAQNDGGVFELNFRDERYLPFEYAGAISRWRIELPQEQNQFDLDTVTDVVMHLNYMAREGGDVLGRAAMDCARTHLPGDGIRLFDVRQDFPSAWHAFQSKNKSCASFELDLKFTRSMFPFIPSGDCLKVSSIQILYETTCPIPSRCQTIEFIAPEGAKHCPPGVRCKPKRIECVASEEWPQLFHGVLGGIHADVTNRRDAHLGSLRFQAESHDVSRLYLLVAYEKCEPCADACYRRFKGNLIY